MIFPYSISLRMSSILSDVSVFFDGRPARLRLSRPRASNMVLPMTDRTSTTAAQPALSAPPEGAAADWTVPQNWERFTSEEHRTWDLLFGRQQEMLSGRAVRAFGEGLDILRLSRPGIPRLDELNERLNARTGWTVVAVPGRLPDDVWHWHLSNRRYPAGNFIRAREELDYCPGPDVFHDLFGHVPLLAQPRWADFVQEIGRRGLQALEQGQIERLARLYWYTIEFGLCREDGGLRIYGAGIVSSFQESRLSLESPEPNRLEFDLPRILRTRIHSGFLQQTYFVVDRFEDLLEIVLEGDLPALYAQVGALPDFGPSQRDAADRLAA